MKHLLTWCSLLTLLLIYNPRANSQGLTPRPGGQRPTPKADKPAGPAEAAPDDGTGEPELPPLPSWPGQKHKKLQFFQMKGYFRFRADMLHNFALGQPDSPTLRAPFPVPISENQKSTRSCAQRRTIAPPGSGGNVGDRDLDEDDCPGNTLGGANLRLRLEPTINVAEKVRVHAQIDIFDNLVMGSTPNGQYGGPAGLGASNRAPHVPLTAFSDTQVPPIAGRNSNTPAILVKRAWAEVTTPLGLLKFGRMPSQWGLGLLANNGSCWDCNFGDNADRVLFATKLANHVLAFGYDFASNGPTSLSVNSGRPYYDGQAIDLEQLDDVDQLLWVAGRIDKPEVIKDKVEQGELVINYGMYLVWRKQDFDYGSGKGLGSTVENYAETIVERSAWAMIPDVWFKLLYKKLYVEFEGVLIGGEIENSSDDNNQEDRLEILQFGWVLRSHYKLLKDALKIGIEVGMASGDQTEATNSDINRRRTLVPQFDSSNPNAAADTSLNEFRFDFDYHVDLILFRELLGTVANAVYFKPTIQYDLLDSIGARLDIIYSLAHRPVAFPGNSANLGFEIDLDLYYRNVDEGFYAGLQYGLLVPLGALDRPEDIYGTRASNAEVAQTLQARLIVKF